MDALAGQQSNDLLPILPQPDAVAGQVGARLGHAKDVSFHRVRIHAQHQIGRGKVEEAEGVGLENLSQVEHLPQLGRRLRDLHGQQRVARLGRGDEVAHRADAADARR